VIARIYLKTARLWPKTAQISKREYAAVYIPNFFFTLQSIIPPLPKITSK